MAKENSILQFIAAGYKVEAGLPYPGAKVRVITNELNVYDAVFLGGVSNTWQYDSNFVEFEKIIAWKYLTIKGK